jgi:hypothetical protein
MPLNERSLELQALADAAVYEGATIRIFVLDGYDDYDEWVTIELEEPVHAKVLKNERQDIVRWTTKDNLDPVWFVDLVGRKPRDLPAGFRDPHVYGIGYTMDGEIEHSPDWELVELA